MSIRCLLLPSTSADAGAARLDAALKLSRRLEAHLRMLFVRPPPEVVYGAMPDVVAMAGVTTEQIEESAKKEAAASRAQFERFCAENGLRSDGQATELRAVFGSWSETVDDVERGVALGGRVSDLVVVNRPKWDAIDAGRIFDAAVFSTGRPTLVVSEKAADDLLGHVVIAWNGSLEAARLVGHAMDLLREADRVSILTVASARSAETGAADLKNYLVWHGIRAEAIEVREKDDAGEALLAAATRAGATLLAMGAYTHSRMRQFLLGGVTRHVLESSDLPVLMEH